MMDFPEFEKKVMYDRFEELGVNQVRSMLGQWSGLMNMTAMKWLAEKDREAHLRNEASQSEQIDIARSAKDAAWSAAEAARASASEARVANELAAAANDLARHANKKAITANRIAAASAAIAAFAIFISVIALLAKH